MIYGKYLSNGRTNRQNVSVLLRLEWGFRQWAAAL